MPGGTIVDEERPYWPRIVTVADKRSELMLFSNAIDLKTCRFSALGEGILSTMEKRRVCPAEIQVNDDLALKALQPFADSLGIRLKTVKNLSAIMEFKKAMAENFSKGRI
jgi:hypothetical protein